MTLINNARPARKVRAADPAGPALQGTFRGKSRRPSSAAPRLRRDLTGGGQGPIGVLPRMSVMLDLAAFTRLRFRETGRDSGKEVAREWRNGRRAGFRCQCPKGRGGSNPPSRTQYRKGTPVFGPGFLCVNHSFAETMARLILRYLDENSAGLLAGGPQPPS